MCLGLVQINLQIQWELTRINVLDVLKPTEEEIIKWNQKRNSSSSSPLDNSTDNKSPKFSFKNDEFDKEENNSSKRNQKPSKLVKVSDESWL